MIAVGFSRGGSMALHMGYEYMKNVGCVGVLSSWLPTTTNIFSVFLLLFFQILKVQVLLRHSNCQDSHTSNIYIYLESNVY